jgi:hypothetical protein
MTGMLNFNFIFSLLSIATFVGAAEISFPGKSKLSGDVVAIDPEGGVTLKTNYGTEPLIIHSDKVEKIDFGRSDPNNDLPNQNLTLINGDSFPVEIRGFDEKSLKVQSPALGELDIPREVISSLELGVFAKKYIYNGPKQIGDWTNPKAKPTEWKVENQALNSRSSGKVYRDVKLPENYAVRFKLKWQAMPNLKFTFSDPMDFSGNSVNLYYLQVGRAGMEIKRETTGRERYPSIASISRLPQEFTNKEVWLEVRVNRKSGRMEFYINDKLEGKYTDKFQNIPSGTGISFHSEAAEENQLSVSNIEVYEWNENGVRHRAEERGDTKEDAVIGKNGERFGGKIISITNGEKGGVLRFKSNFQNDPIELPDSEVSTIFFSASPNVKLQEFDGFNLNFQTTGSLHVSKCALNDATFNITHPLLGELKVDRSMVFFLQRKKSNPPKVDK